MSKKNNWEPEYRYQTVKGSFVDYAGNTRDYTMVAVSIPGTSITMCDCAGYFYGEKMLSIGVAVRSCSDAENGLGERIAYGKATNPRSMNHVMFVTHSGMINTVMVDALLKQEAAHFEKDPGTYIAGYDHDKQRFEKTGKVGTAEQRKRESPQKSLTTQPKRCL